MTGLACLLWVASTGAADPTAENKPAAQPPPNPVERVARGWETKFTQKDYVPGEPLEKALHAYFQQLLKAIGRAAGGDPRDISRVIGQARERQAPETARMIDEFVLAGYRRADAELYFDRLYVRLQMEMVRYFGREDIIGAKPAKPVKAEAAPVSDDLLEKAERLFLEKRDYVGALKMLEDALRFAPDNARVVLDTALRQQKFGQLADARTNFDLARQLYPKIVGIYIGLGDVRVSTQDYYGAIEALTTAIYLSPGAYRAYAIRGTARFRLGDLEGAIDDYGMQIGYGRGVGLEMAYFWRSLAHFYLGNLQIARTDIEAAIRLAPNYAAAHLSLAVLLSRLGDYPAALMAANQAIELQPKVSAPYSSRMWIYYQLGNTAAALKDADRLVELDPERAIARKIRGTLYDVIDRPEQAEAEYREAIRLAQQKGDNRNWYYAHLHLDMLLRRLGRAEPDYMKDVLDWPDDWPKRIVLHLSGRITADSLIKASKQATDPRTRLNQECEANYYVAMLLWHGGRKEEAMPYLQVAAAPAYVGNVEYTQARKLLRKIGSPLPGERVVAATPRP